MFCDLGLFIIIDSMICYINIILYISFVFSFVGSLFFHSSYYIIIYKDMIYKSLICDLMIFLLYYYIYDYY